MQEYDKCSPPGLNYEWYVLSIPPFFKVCLKSYFQLIITGFENQNVIIRFLPPANNFVTLYKTHQNTKHDSC